jgi:ubiquinone/menaquinone biosynthesis C-methylase UbiE
LRVLELGCGHGDQLAHLKPSFGVDIDFSAEMVRVASKRHLNLMFMRADGYDIEFNTNFDVIVLSDLINTL